MPLQKRILDDGARFKVLRCGRRWGKTVTGTIASIAGHGVGRSRIGAINGGVVWWVTPVARQANKYWRYAKAVTENVRLDKNEKDREIYLPGGGILGVRSADDPDTLRGEGLDGVVMDEAAFMQKRVWTNVVRPALSDKGGWAIFPTTPNGFNWFKDLCDNYKDRRGWGFWQLPTSSNPLIPQSEIDAARIDLGELDFRQEYNAEFVRDAESEFGEYLDGSIWWTGEPPADSVVRLVAVDLSKGKTDKSDFTAIVAGYFDPRGYIWVDAEIQRMDMGTISNRTVAWCQYVQPHGTVFEVNGFQELLGDEFRRRAHEANVRTRVDGLDNRTNKRLRIRKTLSTLIEFKKIKFRNSPGGRLLVEQLREFPIGDYDDGPDALEMLIRYHDQVRGFIEAN